MTFLNAITGAEVYLTLEARWSYVNDLLDFCLMNESMR